MNGAVKVSLVVLLLVLCLGILLSGPGVARSGGGPPGGGTGGGDLVTKALEDAAGASVATDKSDYSPRQ